MGDKPTLDYRSDIAPDLQIRGDEITFQPSGYVAEPGTTTTDPHATDTEPIGVTLAWNENEALMKHAARFRSEPLQFLRDVSLYVSGTGWRAYDRIIGQPIGFAGFTETMKSTILASPQLRQKIAELAEKRIAVEEKEGYFALARGAHTSTTTSSFLPSSRLLSSLFSSSAPHQESSRGKGTGGGGGGNGISEAVRRAQRRAEIERGVYAVAEKMVDDMICRFESKLYIRGAYYLVTQMMLRAYHQGIHVSSEEVVRLRRVAEVAAQKKQSLVFLPCHRSHVDYVSLQVICYRLGLTLPTVVAGDNLNFPVVGSFLQNCGAMFIRRSFGEDALYTTLVQTYIDTLLRGGYNLECFIEGGRSRTGKLLPPKFGILKFILESVLSGRVDDAVICPVSTQYDKVIETEGYVTELLGMPKKKENLADFLAGGSSILALRLGRIDVRFHEPWSLRAFIEEQLSAFPGLTARDLAQTTAAAAAATVNPSRTHPSMSPAPPLPTQAKVDGVSGRGDSTVAAVRGDVSVAAVRQRMLRTLGYRVLAQINKVSVVMPTALIGTVLLTLRGRGVGQRELERRMVWLTEQVQKKGGRVAHFGKAPLAEIVARGLEVLGKDLVGMVEGLAEPTYYAVDRFQLSFYRNMTIHLFISEAIVCAAVYTHVKQGGGPSVQDIAMDALTDYVRFLSSIFRDEFIFPSLGLEANLVHTLAGLEADGVLTVTRKQQQQQQHQTEGAVGPLSSTDDIVKVGLSTEERRAGRENFDFYCFLIWPFIESAWLAAVSLLGLTPPSSSESSESSSESSPASRLHAQLDFQTHVESAAHASTQSHAPPPSPSAPSSQSAGWLPATKAQQSAQVLGKTLYHQGDLSYFEAVNMESLRNSYRHLEDEGILEVSRPAATSLVKTSADRPPANTVPVLRITPSWRVPRDPATGRLVAGGLLWNFTEKIAACRREGKNRRDGATVSTRVLRLTDELGQRLYDEVAGLGLETHPATGPRRTGAVPAHL